MSFSGDMRFKGDLDLKVFSPNKVTNPKLRDMLRFWLRWDYLIPLFMVKWFIPLTRKLRMPTLMMYSELEIRKWDGQTGEWIDYGVVARRVITNAGVTFLRDDWNASAQVYANMNFHGIGTGVGAENVTDTALGTESTTALNPNSTRATGTRSTPASNQWRSVGTLTCDADIACTEHGIFDQAATGGGTLWDRSVFAAINLVGANPDSIQCTYTCTLSAGG